MSKAFLITYDLKQPVDNYSLFFTEIKNATKWWHYLPHAWIIITNDDVTSLQSKLVPLTFTGDYLLIVEIKHSYDEIGRASCRERVLRLV